MAYHRAGKSDRIRFHKTDLTALCIIIQKNSILQRNGVDEFTNPPHHEKYQNKDIRRINEIYVSQKSEFIY